MHEHSPRGRGVVVVILVLIAAHALLLHLFLEARLSAVLVGAMAMLVVAKYVARKFHKSRY